MKVFNLSYCYKICLVLPILIIILIFFGGCKQKAEVDKSLLKPVNSGLLYPLSKLNEKHIYLKDSIKYSVAYHNVFFSDNTPLIVEVLDTNSNNELQLIIRQGDKQHIFKENLEENSTENILNKILRTFIQINNDNFNDEKNVNEIENLLISGDEFSYIKALKLLENLIKNLQQKPPSPLLLIKASRAYLNIYLVSSRGIVSSFYIDLLSRAYALDALAWAQLDENSVSADFLYNRVMLNYFTGNIKRAYEIASLCAGQDDRCKIIASLKDPNIVITSHSPDIVYWKMIIMGSENQEERREMLEALYSKNSNDLYAIAWLGSLDLENGRYFTPMLIEKTIQKHLKLISDKFPEWINELPNSRKLFSGKKWIELLKERMPERYQNLLNAILQTKRETDTVFRKLNLVNETFFKEMKYSGEIKADLFSKEDERLLFYHDLITALAEWHHMLTNRWSVYDYAFETAQELNKIFDKDPYIRYMYARALIVNSRKEEAYKIYWDILQKTGDQELILKILSEEEFKRFNALLAKGIIEQIYWQFPENGKLCNYLGSASLLVDNSLRISLYREGLKRDPWNIDAVYSLAWDTNDFSIMKGLLNDFPNNSEAHYYAGVLAYNRRGDIKLSINLLKKALIINPTFSEAANQLGTFLEAQDRYNEAIEVYKEYFSNDSESLGAIHIQGKIGLILLKQNKPKEAVSIFSKLARSYKGSAIKGAVYSYLAVGDIENAELWAKRYVERYPSPSAMSVLCKLYYKTGNMDKFTQSLQKYVLDYPQYSLALANGWQARLSRRDLFEKKFGVLLYKVLSNSPAERVGLVDGDIIIKYGERALDSGYDLDMYKYPLGKKEQLTVLRKGSLITFEIDRGMLGAEYEH